MKWQREKGMQTRKGKGRGKGTHIKKEVSVYYMLKDNNIRVDDEEDGRERKRCRQGREKIKVYLKAPKLGGVGVWYIGRGCVVYRGGSTMIRSCVSS